MNYEWKCPVCGDEVQARSEGGLASLTSDHILSHETKAALKAVFSARRSCSSFNCEMGGRKTWDNRSAALVPTITDNDLMMLKCMRIAYFGDNRPDGTSDVKR